MAENRWQEIRQIHTDNTLFYQIGGGLLLVLIGILIGAVLFSNDSGYGTNIYTEILSVGLTILVLDRLNHRRERRDIARREQERKTDALTQLQEQLVREAGSPVYAVAITAADALRKYGWLGRQVEHDTHALLKYADLSHADLHGAQLNDANLQNATLTQINLSGASLARANLGGASLQDANLSQAYLVGATLSNASIMLTNLSGASLGSANLRGADLRSADFRGVDFFSHVYGGATLHDALIQKSTKFDETTILPDGTNWSTGRDLAEFGAETREIVTTEWNDDTIAVFTFADGTSRRWQVGIGWFDDKYGNPIENSAEK